MTRAECEALLHLSLGREATFPINKDNYLQAKILSAKFALGFASGLLFYEQVAKRKNNAGVFASNILKVGRSQVGSTKSLPSKRKEKPISHERRGSLRTYSLLRANPPLKVLLCHVAFPPSGCLQHSWNI